MSNPFARLKFLPWRSLFQAASLAVLVLALPLDWLLQLAAHYREQSTALQGLLAVLFSPLLGMLFSLAIPIGIGAIAVYFLERINRPCIGTGSLWALVLCLMVVQLLKDWLVFGSVGISEVELVLLAVGVFWKGRPYWQSYRRW